MSKFQLLAKSSANIWVSIGMIYPEPDDQEYQFDSRIAACNAKRTVKNYLKVHRPQSKVPIKIIELG